MTLNEYAETLDALAEELPAVFFDRLNLGIVVEERIKRHPASRADEPMYILGEYRHGGGTGRGIRMYYGSFLAAYGGRPRDEQVAELRRVLHHEFRHHLEFLAGEDALIREDRARLRAYLGE